DPSPAPPRSRRPRRRLGRPGRSGARLARGDLRRGRWRRGSARGHELRRRPLGRPALYARAGDHRRAGPDRGHEPRAPGVHDLRRRHQERVDPVYRPGVRGGRGAVRHAAGPGDLRARRQRVDGLPPDEGRRLRPAGAPGIPAGNALRRAAELRAPADGRRAAGRELPRAPALEPPWRRLRDAQRAGLEQQPHRRRGRAGVELDAHAGRPDRGERRVRGPGARHDRLAPGRVRRGPPPGREGADGDDAGRPRLRGHGPGRAGRRRPERLRRPARSPPGGDDRLRPPGRARPRRLAPVPDRQATARRGRRPAGELHARGDVRRARSALGPRHDRPAGPRRVPVPGRDRRRERRRHHDRL
ncbi:MAG: hypothetical protein AVDCRST_MAG79-2045, partial [uncultured Thermoleophilia bacterium]